MRFSLNLEINSDNSDLLRLRRLYDLDQLLALTQSVFALAGSSAYEIS